MEEGVGTLSRREEWVKSSGYSLLRICNWLLSPQGGSRRRHSTYLSYIFRCGRGGSKLFTCRWLPRHKKAKALVFLCHGYGVECGVFMKGTGIKLAEAGYTVFGIDYEGHGRPEVCG
ncbi:hypothetical protein KP509_22G057600 [Ceratopteris richardii]|uniref:Serine aminopeptidase S33 domain-containing protein n=1 Tax=Ceratopteris richardii TaxID=49495 RepID=A0A8T2S5H2_CERRI|nr:hypothetical protein KP509_22G057600 [Ceratopteris richardii]